MANKKYDKEEGVWRTIGGRRVFIRTGESLPSAMKRSGKFERKQKIQDKETEDRRYLNDLYRDNKITKEQYDNATRADLEHFKKRLNGKDSIVDIGEAYRHYEKDYEDTQWFNERGLKEPLPKEKDYMPGGKKWNPEWESARELKTKQERLDNWRKAGNDSARNYDQVDKEWTDLAKKMEKDYDEFGTTNWKDEKRLNELSTERDRLSIYAKPELKTKEDFIERNKQLELAKDRVNKQYESDMADARMTGNERLEESVKKARQEQLRDIERLQKENREKYNNLDLIDKNIKRDKENWEKGISYEDYSLNKAIEKKTGGKYKTYEELMKSTEKKPYNSKAYAKELSQLYNAEEEYDDKITPKYIQDIDSARYGNMSDEDAIKEWIDGGADIVYADDARAKLKEWGIPVKNDDPYATYRDELARQLLPIYKEDKRVLGLKQRFKGTYEDLKDNTNMSEAEILEFLKKLQNK